VLAPASWWALRKRFRRAMPAVVSPTYLVSALGMTAESVPRSILPSLRQMGLVDEHGKPTELAAAWCEDARYREVCRTIRDRAYPRELSHLAETASDPRAAVRSWFATNAGAGEHDARAMADFYLLLIDADVARQTV
jgi:hypothetical protein